TNRRGLSGASEADRAIWNEFAGNAERVAAEAEESFARMEPARAARDEAEVRVPVGETDVLRLVRARRVQAFLRAAVMTSYDCKCAMSGFFRNSLKSTSTPRPQWLQANGARLCLWSPHVV